MKLQRKMVFRHVTSVGQRKNSEYPWGNEPQTFAFRAPMLYHWAIETPQWVRSITKFLFFSLSIRRFVCQSKYFVSSVHRKKRVALLYQLSCSFDELNCIRFVEELCPSFTIDLFSSESLIGFALNVALKKKYRCLHLKRSLLGRPC